ncbi:hypothetical protein TURU_093076 [Turdus rufiventris]|nr:hypothetical protein TURU_093076 [Turdus rufiventris]
MLSKVYVEFDDLEWEKREWVKVYEDFATFLVEYQLVWAKRKDPSQTQGSKIKQIQWPALAGLGYGYTAVDNPVSWTGVSVCVSELYSQFGFSVDLLHSFFVEKSREAKLFSCVTIKTPSEL